MLQIEVGQTVWIERQGNAARYYTGDPEQTTITKIGRKYFEVEKLHKTKFRVESGVQETEHGVNYIIRLSREEIEDRKERDFLLNKIRQDFFGSYGTKCQISLDQLRNIKAILYND